MREHGAYTVDVPKDECTQTADGLIGLDVHLNLKREPPNSKHGDDVYVIIFDRFKLKYNDNNVCLQLKLKVKLSLCTTKHRDMETYWGSGGIAPRIV
jgi:hypothetical protein